jgi:nucleotide-binding universal stress UspA family protein
MGIKHILIHIDSGSGSDVRVTLALQLARRLQAYVTGLFVVPSPDLMIPPDSGGGAAAIATAIAAMEEAADAIGGRFLAMLEADQLMGEWIRLTGSPVMLVTRHAAAADLVILGQHDPLHSAILEMPEDIILSCGRPVLMVPHTGQFERVGEQVVIAWNGSREAVRALHDALPLMDRSRAVAIVSVNPKEEATEVGDQLVRHLARRGLNAEAETVRNKELAAADAVLRRAASSGSDLIVMGAYGHSRLREMILGGMTQEMLRRMDRPVLMAH